MATTSKSWKPGAVEAPASAISGAALRFTPPLYLAPMEGITDASFRSLVLEENGAGTVGAACTEFQRVTQQPLPLAVLQRELGAPANPDLAGRVPVGIQLMGNEPEVVAETAVRAAAAGAAFIDLNFGCPAPRVFQHCAGSALLADPVLLERMVRTVADACPLPVTAKIRSGIENDAGVEDIAKRIEQAGASVLAVHARLRTDRYSDPSDWTRLERVRAAVSLPLYGNGDANSPANIARMFRETGVDGVMVGRGAVANPWIFRDYARLLAGQEALAATHQELLSWLRSYAARMIAGGATPRQALGRLKMAFKALLRGGQMPSAEGARQDLLRLQEADDFLRALDDLVPAPTAAGG